VAEWSIAAVLKTALPQGNGGSNPSLSAAKGPAHVGPGLMTAIGMQALPDTSFQ
jgi:hypothetical protein